MNLRQTALQILTLLTIATTALMVWKAVSIVTNTEIPVVVVLSESMSPGFDRGDLLLLSLPKNEPIQINDICVFKLPGRDIPVVHRVIKMHTSSNSAMDSNSYILTKGDFNPRDDRVIYNEGQMWIHEDNIVGKVKGLIPHIGMISIWMNVYPWLKFAFIGVLGLFCLLQPQR